MIFVHSIVILTSEECDRWLELIDLKTLPLSLASFVFCFSNRKLLLLKNAFIFGLFSVLDRNDFNLIFTTFSWKLKFLWFGSMMERKLLFSFGLFGGCFWMGCANSFWAWICWFIKEDRIKDAELFLSKLLGCELPSSTTDDVDVEEEGNDSSFGNNKSLDNELLLSWEEDMFRL